jgi:hypothetical protein
MSDIWKIVLTAAFTVVGGVIIYVLGHLLEVIFIEPIQRFRSLTGEIADSLVYYSNIYSNAGTVEREKMDEASEVYRHEASRLRAEKYAIPCYDFWAFLHFTRTTKEVEEASQKLIYLSNAVYGGPGIDLIHNIKQAEEANELLGIKKKIQKKRGDKFEINVAMLSHGVLLFSFSQILLAFKVRSIDIYFWHIDYPSWFSGLYKGFGVIALVVSAVALLGVFNKHVGGKFYTSLPSGLYF